MHSGRFVSEDELNNETDRWTQFVFVPSDPQCSGTRFKILDLCRGCRKYDEN
jgi:hypothetical protein